MEIETFGGKEVKERYDAGLWRLIQEYSKENGVPISEVKIWYEHVPPKKLQELQTLKS